MHTVYPSCISTITITSSRPILFNLYLPYASSPQLLGYLEVKSRYHIFRRKDLKVLNTAACVNEIVVAGLNKRRIPPWCYIWNTCVPRRVTLLHLGELGCLPYAIVIAIVVEIVADPFCSLRQFGFTQKMNSEISIALQICADDVLEGWVAGNELTQPAALELRYWASALKQ